MERFLFDADAQWAPIGTLSGGERRRLQLLLVLAELPNVLLLDEPTNDLDLDTLRALEDYLEGWPGSLVVVSHDRALLERTVEDVLVLDGVGGARLAPGGYAEYEADRRRRREGGERRAAPATDAARRPAARRPPRRPRRRRRRAPRPKPRSASTLRRLVTIAEREMAEAADRRQPPGGELSRRPPATTPPWPPRPTPWPRPRSPWPRPRTAGWPSPRSSAPSRRTLNVVRASEVRSPPDTFT